MTIQEAIIKGAEHIGFAIYMLGFIYALFSMGRN